MLVPADEDEGAGGDVHYVTVEQDPDQSVANMASYAISSSLILVIHDNMIIGTNLIVLACLCRQF
jgi:hypothetical protein